MRASPGTLYSATVAVNKNRQVINMWVQQRNQVSLSTIAQINNENYEDFMAKSYGREQKVGLNLLISHEVLTDEFREHTFDIDTMYDKLEEILNDEI